MKFGVFDHMDRGAGPLDRFYADRLALVEAYDKAGFYGYHVAEHHATPLGLSPSPSVYLSAVAQRTHRLRLGPLVYTLPLYHPLRLIDEVCMLDQMSGGRMLLGVGRGISPIENRYFGHDPAHTGPMYAEALEVLLRGLTTDELTYEGKYYQFRNVPMELAPLQRPHPPLWYGIGRPDGTVWTAQHKVNIVTNLNATLTRAINDRYRAEWRTLGHPPETIPLLGSNRHIVMADTDKEALETARPAYRQWRASFLKLWNRHNMQLPNPNALFPEEFDEAEATGRAVAGSPAKVRDFLARDIADSGVNYLLCRFAFGSLTRAEMERSLTLFTRHVMEELEESSPSP
jgi:alkanesulfonate monooxygenase SsuD/methylene tetrahydromethanopterin reductase-like flavin-dependent oxidoreductase (luciferase family)